MTIKCDNAKLTLHCSGLTTEATSWTASGLSSLSSFHTAVCFFGITDDVISQNPFRDFWRRVLDIGCVLFTACLCVWWEFVCMERKPTQVVRKLCLQSLCYYLSRITVQLPCILSKSFLRDHPNTIKRHFTSVLCVSAASPLVVLAWTNSMKVRLSVGCQSASCIWMKTLQVFRYFIKFLLNKLLFIYINLFKFNVMYIWTCYSQVHHCGHCWAFIFFPAALLPLTLTMVCYCCLLFCFTLYLLWIYIL